MNDHTAGRLRTPQLPDVVRRHGPAPNEADADYAPIVRLQRIIFEEAVSQDASDVHIEPHSSSSSVRFRVNGLMKDAFEVPRWLHDNLIARIKILAKLDISERRIPQDGHIGSDEGAGPDIRVSVLPSRSGEKVVMRFLRSNKSIRSIAELDVSLEVEDTLRALVHRPQGAIIVVGPTGSGKTTTLYSMVHEVCREPLNIVTIEDPVEFEIERITQVQVHEKTGLTFARALRAILRQDPDVILVGEVRDSETAKTAFDAAMTGHLVLTTLHTTDCVSAASRLVELGVTRDQIASGTAAIIAQRLIRLNCPMCSEQDVPRSIYLRRLGIPECEQFRLRRGIGCPSCNFTGIKGRTGLYEVVEVNKEIRSALQDGSEEDMRRVLRSNGVRGLMEQALDLVLSGATSAAEAYRTCYFGGGLND
jgi:type II secretory ATPase GspE/PulE/Tfp pilus assembly ATPase PilB-like protein